MSRFQFTIAHLLMLVTAAAVLAGAFRLDPRLGLALLAAVGLALAGYLFRDVLASLLGRVSAWLGYPTGRVGLVLLGAWIVTGPAVLFYDPATYAPRGRGHIDRPPRDYYKLASDDVAYIAASRTWDRTVANLMVPHNTHVVPTWRLLTWGLVACAGGLPGLPDVLAVTSYGILVTVMLMTGRFVTRETGRIGPGLAAASLVGTTSLMLTPAMWYSGGQPLWAGLGILATLWYAQSFRRNGRWPALVLASLAAALAGGIWSAGHLAGPVAAVYLWLDGRRRCRLAAAVPLAATAVAAGLMLSFAAQPMDSKVSFHGRTVREAADPIQGAISTAQAIPECLIFANLGLDAPTSPIQGVVLTLLLAALWAGPRCWRRLTGHDPGRPAESLPDLTSRRSGAFHPLECAGAALVVGCYMLEWTFRGYLEYPNMRTLNPYAVVPWYDVLPQIGAVLFAVGWWTGARRPADGRPTPTRSAALGIALLALALVALNRPRVDTLIRQSAPAMLPSELGNFKIPRLQLMRADTILSMRVEQQRKYLRRLDRAEAVARRLGIGQDGIRAAFGHIFIPYSTGRLLLAHRELYDVAAILDIPARGRTSDVATIRAAMSPYLVPEPEPRPDWLGPGEKWAEQ